MQVNEMIKGKSVKFVKGEYTEEIGTFKRIIGYNSSHGYICEIYIGGEFLEFTADFFQFVDPEVQEAWQDDTYDFKSE